MSVNCNVNTRQVYSDKCFDFLRKFSPGRFVYKVLELQCTSPFTLVNYPINHGRLKKVVGIITCV